MLFQRTHIKDSGNYFKGDNLITVLVNKKQVLTSQKFSTVVAVAGLRN